MGKRRKTTDIEDFKIREAQIPRRAAVGTLGGKERERETCQFFIVFEILFKNNSREKSRGLKEGGKEFNFWEKTKLEKWRFFYNSSS